MGIVLDDVTREPCEEGRSSQSCLVSHWEAYRLCGDWHEAEDLVQSTLYQIHRRWRRLGDHEKLSAYTRRAMVNTYISEHRRQRWTREVSYADVPEHGVADRESTDASNELLAAVGLLGPRQRAIITLRFWYDLNSAQIANLLGCSIGTVTSQTHRAGTRLRDILIDAPAPHRPARS